MPCVSIHERARRDSAVFATLHPIGSMWTEDDDGNRVELRLANCHECNSTIAKERVVKEGA